MKQNNLTKPQSPCTDNNQNRPKAKRAKTGLKAKGPSPTPTQPADQIKVGLDVGLRKYALCRQVDGSLQDPPRAIAPEAFKEWIVKQKTLAKRVTVCYEAGLFGFELARWLIAQGMECVVMAPVKLDEGNKRVETDKLNAQDICSRLDRFLAGNTRALTACRIATRQEELARQQTRQRQQLLKQRNALGAQGRSLLWQFGDTWVCAGDWWASPLWEIIKRDVDPKVVGGLQRLRAVILEISKQLEQLVKELAQQAAEALPKPLEKLPLGIGWLSMLILTREFMDWGRFTNRRQVSCFGGLVPSESSTGESVRQGSVTKVGNPVVRAILVEMAWRLVRYQPDCHAVKPWLHILQNKKAGPRARKKAIVAVARVLGVDLWRLATGQTTCQKLGFKVA
jgi:transposase